MEDWELENDYVVETSDLKSIERYTGLNFEEIRSIPYYLFCLYRKDAWIHSLKGTEEGRKFLKELRDLTRTEPDYEALSKVVQKEIKNK
ncbi:MAG: hypothetical protein ACRDD2_11165 [Sarcina sp.]